MPLKFICAYRQILQMPSTLKFRRCITEYVDLLTIEMA